MIKKGTLHDTDEMPLVLEPATGPMGESCADAIEWIQDQRERIEEDLIQHGALLFRGFPLRTAEEFESFASCFGPELLSYVGGDSPRERVTQKVYTSTSVPSNYQIPLHSELSFARQWPGKVLFFCQMAPETGGETSIGDCRRILELLDPEITERFEKKQVKYVQNIHGGWGLGKSWQQTFETDQRSDVENFCTSRGVDFQWMEDGSLRTSQVRPGVAVHPQTGERLWFNQADQWHRTSWRPEDLQSMLKIMKEDELPHGAYHGDGSEIATADLNAIRQVYHQAEVLFPWRAGDVLMLDNMLVAHGRKAFTGPRDILVAMA